MKWWQGTLAALVLFGGGFGTGALTMGLRRPHTQIAAVCDTRGNLVYETNTGNVFVLPGKK
jgi:hypothetical protein